MKLKEFNDDWIKNKPLKKTFSKQKTAKYAPVSVVFQKRERKSKNSIGVRIRILKSIAEKMRAIQAGRIEVSINPLNHREFYLKASSDDGYKVQYPKNEHDFVRISFTLSVKIELNKSDFFLKEAEFFYVTRTERRYDDPSFKEVFVEGITVNTSLEKN